MTEQHQDFAVEKQHLADIITEMKEIIKGLHQDIDDRLQKANKSLLIKDEISAYVHTMMRNDNANKIYDMEEALPSPYFGRVDFREDEADDFQSFYIGRCKIARLQIEKDDDILVFDWRDPVSTIFYECYNGRASYEVLGRYRYSGDVRLKRQYKIENSELKSMADNYVMDQIMARQQEALISDPLLAERLRQGAADKLKDIVTSIQAEQNKIIREPFNQVTVIQGVAGSGKSTIGLHRLSYLLYNEKIKPEKLIVIAPNRIFLDYISELLPQIDAADVPQMVWDDMIAIITRRKWTLAKQNLELIIAGKDKARIRLITDTAQLKGSLDFVQVLHTYIEQKIRKFCLKLKDISLFEGNLTITTHQQLERFMEDAKTPYNERLRRLIHYITFRVTNYVEVLEARKGKAAKEQAKMCSTEAEAFLNKYFNRWTPLELLAAYRELFATKSAFKPVKDKRYDFDAIRSSTIDILNSGYVEREDLAPLAYLTYLLDGWTHVPRYQHIVIDEAQDLNALEFAILKRLSENRSFTIMGDLSQGIHSYRSIGNWNVVLKEVFADARTVYREIRHSYRSAKEIIDVFNCVMPPGHPHAIPVYEIGRKPAIEKILSTEQGLRRIISVLQAFSAQGSKSIGIITKQEDAAEELYQSLLPITSPGKLTMPLHLVSGQEACYQGGISVLPVSLAKGLEFDSVIIWNASRKEYPGDSLSTRLLYVALSRAMYSLHIMYQGSLTPLLTSIGLDS